jgi:hypothetical protein
MSIVNAASRSGPNPAAHARRNSSRVTRSSWRTAAHTNSRNHVPTVDAARAPSNNAAPAPARNTATSSMQSPPANADPTTVNAFAPAFAEPCPRSVTYRSTSSPTPSFCANSAATASPPLGTNASSSKLNDTRTRAAATVGRGRITPVSGPRGEVHMYMGRTVPRKASYCLVGFG